MPWVWTEQDEKDYQKKRQDYLDKPLEETTYEWWDQMLGAVPPLVYRSSAAELPGFTECAFFLCGEMTFDSITHEYYKNGDRYYWKYVDARDKSTWITQLMIYELNKSGSIKPE